MKKILAVFILAGLFYVSAFAQELTVTDTLGGNTDKLEGGDLLGFYVNGKDGSTYLPSFSIADRLQLDYNYSWFTARGRLDGFLTGGADSSSGFQFSDVGLYFNGFARVQPLQQIGLIAGNSFFSQLGMNCGQMYALDDTPSYGKLLKDGVGLCSTIPIGDTKIKVAMAGGIEFDSFQNDFSNWIYSGGLEVYKSKLFSVGATARNFTQGAYGKYAVLGGFYPKNFAVNAGFIYNNTSEDYLPCESKYSISLSGGYKNKDIGLKVYADVVSGLTNEYISTSHEKTKYYDGYIPLMAALRVNYAFTEQLEAGLNVKYTKLLYKTDSGCVTVYPNVEYEFNDLFSLNGGLRLSLDASYDQIVKGISVPVSFKYKFKTTF